MQTSRTLSDQFGLKLNEARVFTDGVQVWIVIEPPTLAEPARNRALETVKRIVDDHEARLPGDRRVAARARVEKEGTTIPLPLYEKIAELAGGA